MVAHNFNSSIQEAEADGLLCVQVQPGLSSRTARARHRQPVLKKKKKAWKILAIYFYILEAMQM